jgi:hypothetical protein
MAWLILSQYITPKASLQPTKPEPIPDTKIEPDTDSSTGDLSDTPRTFPTFSRQPPLQYPTPRSTPGVEYGTGDEEEGEDLGGEPVTGEADDEEEYQAGVGAAFNERPMDSGVGTSFSEAGGRSLQRRRSRGRPA